MAEVDTITTDVFTVKVALLLPAGTVTLAATLAAPLLLDSVTCAPPAGAGPLSVTVPVEDCTPPTTLEGCSSLQWISKKTFPLPCLVLVGTQVGATALRAGFAVDVGVDVAIQVGDDRRGQPGYRGGVDAFA